MKTRTQLVQARLQDLWLAVRTPPRDLPLWLWCALTGYGILALAFGLLSGLLVFDPLHSSIAPALPFTLLVLPSLVEEIVFRGLLIPRDIALRGPLMTAAYVGMATVVYVAWHPFYARFLNPKAGVYFFDIRFLAVAAALGVVCALGYAYTKSLWVAVLTHWATVMVWVFLFAGRNLVLD